MFLIPIPDFMSNNQICGLEIEADLFQIRTMKDGWCCPCCCGMRDDFLFISVKIPRESFLSPRVVAKKWKQILSEGFKHRRIIGLVQHVMEIRKTIRVTLNKLLHRKWTRQKFIKAPSYFMLVVVCGLRMNSFSLHLIWFSTTGTAGWCGILSKTAVKSHIKYCPPHYHSLSKGESNTESIYYTFFFLFYYYTSKICKQILPPFISPFFYDPASSRWSYRSTVWYTGKVFYNTVPSIIPHYHKCSTNNIMAHVNNGKINPMS